MHHKITVLFCIGANAKKEHTGQHFMTRVVPPLELHVPASGHAYTHKILYTLDTSNCYQFNTKMIFMR